MKKTINKRAMVVAQLSEWSLPTSKDTGSNPFIGTFSQKLPIIGTFNTHKTKIKQKRPRNDHFRSRRVLRQLEPNWLERKICETYFKTISMTRQHLVVGSCYRTNFQFANSAKIEQKHKNLC